MCLLDFDSSGSAIENSCEALCDVDTESFLSLFGFPRTKQLRMKPSMTMTYHLILYDALFMASLH